MSHCSNLRLFTNTKDNQKNSNPNRCCIIPFVLLQIFWSLIRLKFPVLIDMIISFNKPGICNHWSGWWSSFFRDNLWIKREKHANYKGRIGPLWKERGMMGPGNLCLKGIFWLTFHRTKDDETRNKYVLTKMDGWVLYPFEANKTN